MLKYFIFYFLIIFASPVMAQNLTDSDSPVEISADNSLEWMQKDKQYIANGNVEVVQGNAKIICNKLIADYRENQKTGNTEIWQLTAFENVKITSQESTAQGDKAVYNIDTGLSILTGNNLTLTLPNQTITASERMEYNMNNGNAKAIGNAKIKRGTDLLSANVITANFAKDGTGKQNLKTANADGNVTIKTVNETLTGNKAVYNAVDNTAEISGNVKIVRGPNILEGARAEVNLTTNISKMFGAPESGKRVKGVFFPSSDSKKDTQ